MKKSTALISVFHRMLFYLVVFSFTHIVVSHKRAGLESSAGRTVICERSSWLTACPRVTPANPASLLPASCSESWERTALAALGSHFLPCVVHMHWTHTVSGGESYSRDLWKQMSLFEILGKAWALSTCAALSSCNDVSRGRSESISALSFRRSVGHIWSTPSPHSKAREQSTSKPNEKLEMWRQFFRIFLELC